MKIKKIPLRMCIICRQMHPKSDMIRVVRSPEGELNIDTTGKMPGRGAYICSSKDCIDKCVSKRVINKKFKTDVDKQLYASIEDEYKRKQ